MRRTFFVLALALVLALGIGIGRLATRDGVPIMLAATTASAAAQHARPVVQAAGHAPEYLFAQDANAGTFTRVAGRHGVYTLALTGVRPSALYFTDRPDRIVGALSVRGMLRAVLGNPEESKPNAAVNVVDLGGRQVLMGVELMSAVYHPHARTLDYTVRKLKQGAEETRHPGLTDRMLPGRFGETSILVDDFLNLCSAWINNDTSQEWTLQSATLNNSHDTWADDGYPQTTIGLPSPPGATDAEEYANTEWRSGWMSVGGFLRGCSNTVVYQGADGATATVYASAPFGGGNVYNCVTSSRHYTCTYTPSPSTDEAGEINVVFILAHT